MLTAPRIASVHPLEGARLLVTFRNGAQRIYDCTPLLAHGDFQWLSQPAFFRTVRVDPGGYGVSWNADLDLSEYELWTNGTPVSNVSIPPVSMPGATRATEPT